ncbi:MAG: DUF4876 domain-containing protein [Calditrichaeota bacterium]|nr:DUF4876 domain-containing protein [Calditrichota bacterium]
MKKIAIFIFILFSMGSCDKILQVEKKPVAIERKTPIKILLFDDSGYMEKIYGRAGVPGVSLKLQSNSLGQEFTFFSDSTGLVNATGLLSDDYFVTAERKLTPEEVEKATGEASENVALKNVSIKKMTIRADVDSTLILPMDLVITGAGLVISEIYACGPPDAGLYFHDKYLELYNQSDSIIYLDGLLVAVVSKAYPRDDQFVYSKNVWQVPGDGADFPLSPGEFAVLAEDGIDHTINAPGSVDLSRSRLEFYKPETPDIDNPDIPNMQLILQVFGYDWLIGGEKDAIVIARVDPDSLEYRDEHLLIPYDKIIDGVEYLDDPTRLQDKKLHEKIDAGAAGGIEFYTGKSMERKVLARTDKLILKDDDNSSLDFITIDSPTPGYHHDQ